MNTNSPQNEREELEVRVTALVLGELDPAEAEEVRRAVAADPELDRNKARMERTIELIRDALGERSATGNIDLNMPRLSDARRKRLKKLFAKRKAQSCGAKSRRSAEWVVPLSIAAAFVVLMGFASLLLGLGQVGRARAKVKATLVSTLDAQPSAARGFQSDDLLNVSGVTMAGHEAVAAVDTAGPARKESRREMRTLKLPIAPVAQVQEQDKPANQRNVRIYLPTEAQIVAKADEAAAPNMSRNALEAFGQSVGEPRSPTGGQAPTDLRMLLRYGLLPRDFKVSVQDRKRTESVERDEVGAQVPSAGIVGGGYGGVADAGYGGGIVGAAGYGGQNGTRRTGPMKRGADAIDVAERNIGQVPQAGPSTVAPPAFQPVQAGRSSSTPTFLSRQAGDWSFAPKAAAGKPVARTGAEEQQRTKPLGDLGASGLQVTEEISVPAGKEVVAGRGGEPVLGDRPVQGYILSEHGVSLGTPGIVTNAVPEPQPEVLTAEDTLSTFSLNISDVSFRLTAASLENGTVPAPASIRSEEFINAFDYRDPEPTVGMPMAFSWERAHYPFAHNRDIIRFSIRTAAVGRDSVRPMNLVLLLDNSGSMERADRVLIIREAVRVLARQLRPGDVVSVVSFARTARLYVDGLTGDRAIELVERVENLAPEGGTNLEDALKLAYETAARHFLPAGLNRIVLLTDGAANLGDVDPESLKLTVTEQRKRGIALDCFGIGWEGYNDELLEVLSRNGDGRYGFLNTPEEAATDFAAKLAGALQVAAADVKVQIEFNPHRVISWRQIGYAKYKLRAEEFRDNTVDAAEVAAAESGNALYVIQTNPAGEGNICVVRVRYREPSTGLYREMGWQVPYTGIAKRLENASAAMRLAVVAGAFSERLASNPYASEVKIGQLLGYLKGVPEVFDLDPRPKKLEWMLRQYQTITGE